MTAVTAVTAVTSAAREGQVTHGFLEGPRPFFGSYHAPAAPFRDIGYVICPPLGWEGIQCYETVQRLADALSAAGFHTLRLHYDGTGESIGSDDDPGRVAAWLESIRLAVSALGALPGVAGVGLIGIRIGATLAGRAAADQKLRALVLWEPCVSGAQYTREMEILASASPTAARGKAAATDGIEGGGYLLTRETVDALNTIDLMKSKPDGSPDALLLCRDDRPPLFAKKLAEHLSREGCAAKLEQMPGYKELMTYPEKAKPGLEMVARIRDWAVERSQVAAAPDAGEAPRLALAEEAVEDRARRRPIRFGPSRRMFGVITEPFGTAANRTKPPVLMLTGGVVPRTAVNRMYVEIATRLAQHGHTVLRMDVSGICESAAGEGHAPNDPHAKTLLEDVRTAVELLLSTTRQQSITLLGLCSGAYASFQTAIADPRVRGIVLLNPEVFHLKDGSPKFSQTEQSLAAKHYRQSLLSAAAWKKLLTGKANVRYIGGFVTAKAKTAVVTLRDRISARITKVPQGLPGDLHRLLSRGVNVAVVMAEGDTGHESLMTQLSADLDMLREMGFRLKMTPGPDHTFNDFATRRPLVDWLVEVLSQ